MRKTLTIIWTGIVLLIFAAVGRGWYLYERPHQSAAGESSALTIDAGTLYRQYQTDERLADAKYLGKIITVTGRLSQVQHNGKATFWILATQPGGGGINCQLFAGTTTGPEPKPGDSVTFKGRCTGFLMDVNVTDCVPEK